ncbi:hypothetical protein BOTBODRAFT_52993 [Botryobasidium botryosum FD-172 SS1]|uniref:C3H1-type domain-containing protein n=1 Tax=Botryobasidium botryosum (strain FD-172 SS1) TaxID=930990 RepID=A0A067N229_BOTB1|nr:hypothetical protein BOTBODRAFT_52993 [Botryobasidium botryosum FD-172 SS1]
MVMSGLVISEYYGGAFNTRYSDLNSFATSLSCNIALDPPFGTMAKSKKCTFYSKPGGCRHGDACKFQHVGSSGSSQKPVISVAPTSSPPPQAGLDDGWGDWFATSHVYGTPVPPFSHTAEPTPGDGDGWRSIEPVVSLRPANGFQQNRSDGPAGNPSDVELDLLRMKLSSESSGKSHENVTAPLFTRGVLDNGDAQELRQYAVYGEMMSVHSQDFIHKPVDNPSRLYVNMNAPFSAVVCGVQGSGKSHTVNVMLENALILERRIGVVEKSLSALVLHLGEGGKHSAPCEAAYQGVLAEEFRRLSPSVLPPPVVVYCSPSSMKTMRAVYEPLTRTGNVTVKPLKFDKRELDAESFLAMMAVEGTSETAPLYIRIILNILRTLGEDNYSYDAFVKELELEKRDFNPAQQTGLKQRLKLLQSFLKDDNNEAIELRFKPGQLTIIDLSDSFLDPTSACGLFEIITRQFVRADVGTGKILVLDEAHKYLGKSGHGLKEALLYIIRQQRHFAMRVIISTQEPTVIPASILDLTTVTILHRFSARSWWNHLANHVSTQLTEEGFNQVVNLQTGEALVIAPSGLVMLPSPEDELAKRKLGRDYMVVKTRGRVTMDGGSSVLVVP